MKKLYILFALAILSVFPTKLYAAVDFNLADNSTTTVKSLSVTVNTGAEALSNVEFTIQGSEDMTFTDVSTGTVSCTTFNKNITGQTVNIVCNLAEETTVNGIIANVLFTATSEDYTVEVLEDSIKIDTLKVGNIVNIGTFETTEAPDDATTVGQDEEAVEKTTEVATDTNTTETGFDIMNYLPYILLGGSVILLISIIGVLLSKKKNKNPEVITEETPKVESVSETQTISKEPTLKDMVNLNTPMTQETPQETTVAQEVAAPTQAEEKDLQDILNKEQTPQMTMAPEMPSTPPTNETPAEVASTPVMETPLSMPMNTPPIQEEQTESNQAPAEVSISEPTTDQPIDLQKIINDQIQQIPPEAMNTEEKPATEEPAEEEALPPVPPQM